MNPRITAEASSDHSFFPVYLSLQTDERCKEDGVQRLSTLLYEFPSFFSDQL